MEKNRFVEKLRAAADAPFQHWRFHWFYRRTTPVDKVDSRDQFEQHWQNQINGNSFLFENSFSHRDRRSTALSWLIQLYFVKNFVVDGFEHFYSNEENFTKNCHSRWKTSKIIPLSITQPIRWNGRPVSPRPSHKIWIHSHRSKKIIQCFFFHTKVRRGNSLENDQPDEQLVIM